jgi:hypothetical protein
MKILAGLLACILLSVVKLYCQQYDSLDIDKISINKLPFGAQKSDVLKKLGKPASITFQPVQGEAEASFNYLYKKSVIQLDTDGNLVGFTILDTSFILSCNSFNIKIGDSINILRKYFPRTYKIYKMGGDKFFRLPFKGSDIQYILITIKNNRILKFETWVDLT